MSRDQIRSTSVFALLVAAGIGLRLAFQDLPNFSPVAAIALFAGFYFRSAVAVAAVALVMLISDKFIGGYEGPIMLAVYASLALPIAMRWIMRSNVGSRFGFLRSSSTIFGCSLLGSVLFFAITNLAVWGFSGLYTLDGLGLTNCFTQALPFFRYTVMGDLTFAFGFFGAYALAKQTIASVQPVAQAA